MLETTFPRVANLTKSQRDALLAELIKAHFADVGMPWYLPVHDGDVLLGTFHPEFPRPSTSSIPDFPPEYIAELRRRIDTEEKTSQFLTTEEVQLLLESENDRKPHE